MKASFFGDDELDNKSEGTAAEHENKYDFNHNQSRRAGLLGKRLQDLRASSQTVWKEAGIGGALSEASSQLDFVMQNSPLLPSSSGSVISIMHEIDPEVNYFM